MCAISSSKKFTSAISSFDEFLYSLVYYCGLPVYNKRICYVMLAAATLHTESLRMDWNSDATANRIVSCKTIKPSAEKRRAVEDGTIN